MNYAVQLHFTLYHKDQRQQEDSRVLLWIIAVKINFSLGFDNTDYRTNKLQFLQME